jgi:two-component system, NtrC family, nitrogen regulation response regulator NtrX
MTLSNNILVVDDDEFMGEVLEDILCLKGYNVTWVRNGVEAIHTVTSKDIDLVLLDFVLPDINGIEVLNKIREIKPSVIVIMISGHSTIGAAVQATRSGAYDWLEKPLEKERVLRTVQNALEKFALGHQREFLLNEIRERYKMIGSSPAIRSIFELIDRVAPTQSTVLITGESGTGKELVARAIHMNSPRAGSPFIYVNCAAIPDTLIESELFGHVKGSYTGAFSDKEGKFQAANHGTLFLDEIGDLSQMAQAKILRAIDTNEITRIGAQKVERIDNRLITATNRNLKEMVDDKTFREDLFHRICVISIHIPPLRERLQDILDLMVYYLNYFCQQNKMHPKVLSSGAKAVLMSYKWPGNVRELKNLIEKIVILIDGENITSTDVSLLLNGPDFIEVSTNERLYAQAKASFEKNYLLNSLEQNNWNVVKTAELTGIERSVLYKKMEKYGIKKSQKEDM